MAELAVNGPRRQSLRALAVLALPSPGGLWAAAAAPMPALTLRQPDPSMHLRPDDRVRDLLGHPLLRDCARRMLPWDEREPDPDLRLRDLATLLPYHRNVRTDEVLAGLNRLIDDAAAGHRICLDVHDSAKLRGDPGLRHTGAFVFRGPPGAPFALIAPGGGFAYVGSVHEGFPYALALNRLGCHAVVVKYRAGQGGEVATRDMAAALTLLFREAAVLGMDTCGYSLWGSSAGARMAAAIGTHGAKAFGGADLPGPAAVVMAYTGHAEVGPQEPPTFAVVGAEDGIAPPGRMAARIAALQRQGTPAVLRVIPGLGHGFGTGAGTAAQGWVDEAVRFWLAARGPAPD